MRIGMTRVYVRDVSAAFRFYTEVLGFVEKLRAPEADLAIVVSAEEPEGSTLLLEPNASPVAKSYQEAVYRAGLPEIVFFVKDVQSEFERLKRLGVAFRQEPTKADWGTFAVFDDTCGNFIQLFEA